MIDGKVKKILSLLLLTAFIFLVCFKIIIRGEVLFTGDNFDLLFPQKYFWLEEIKNGRLPLWNPYILSGTPYLADINLGTLAPSNLIYLIIHPVEKAASFLLFFELLIIAVFTYLSARRLKISAFSSFISGAIFATSGTMAVYSSNLAILNVVAFLPVIFYLLLIYLDFKQLKYLLFAAILFAWQILSGHAQLTFISGLFFIVILFTGELTFTKKISSTAIFFCIAAGLTAVQLLPFAEFAFLTPRVGQNYAWATAGSMGFSDLVKLILPKLTYQFTGWVDFSSKANLGYIGVVPFILFIVGTKLANKRLTKFKIAALVFLLLSLGGNTFFYKIAYYLVPGISLFRVPSQFIIIYSFCAALIAGWGLDSLSKLIVKIKKPQWFKQSIPLLLICFFVLCYLLFRTISNISGFSLLVGRFNFFPKQIVLQPLKTAIFLTNGIVAVQMIIIFTIAVCLGIFKKNKLFKFLISAVILADLLLSFSANLQTAKISQINIQTKINLPQLHKSDYRIYTLPPDQKVENALFFPVVEQFFSRQKKELELPNQNIYTKNYAVDGYASMALSKYLNQFTNAYQTITGLGKINLNQVNLGKYAVKYVISDEKKADLSGSYQLIFDNYPFIYQVKDLRPRYFLTNGNNIILQDQNPVRLVFATQTYSPTHLVLLDSFYPGWQVRLDNQPVQISSYEDIFRQVSVPAGNHLVVFEFISSSFITGSIISGLALFAVIILLCKQLWKETS